MHLTGQLQFLIFRSTDSFTILTCSYLFSFTSLFTFLHEQFAQVLKLLAQLAQLAHLEQPGVTGVLVAIVGVILVTKLAFGLYELDVAHNCFLLSR